MTTLPKFYQDSVKISGRGTINFPNQSFSQNYFAANLSRERQKIKMRMSLKDSSETLKKFPSMSRRKIKKIKKKFSSNYSLGHFEWSSNVSSESFSVKTAKIFCWKSGIDRRFIYSPLIKFPNCVSLDTQELQFWQFCHNYSAKFQIFFSISAKNGQSFSAFGFFTPQNGPLDN